MSKVETQEGSKAFSDAFHNAKRCMTAHGITRPMLVDVLVNESDVVVVSRSIDKTGQQVGSPHELRICFKSADLAERGRHAILYGTSDVGPKPAALQGPAGTR